MPSLSPKSTNLFVNSEFIYTFFFSISAISNIELCFLGDFLHQHSESYYYAYSDEYINLDFHVTLQTYPTFWSWISSLPNLKSIWFARIRPNTFSSIFVGVFCSIFVPQPIHHWSLSQNLTFSLLNHFFRFSYLSYF